MRLQILQQSIVIPRLRCLSVYQARNLMLLGYTINEQLLEPPFAWSGPGSFEDNGGGRTARHKRLKLIPTSLLVRMAEDKCVPAKMYGLQSPEWPLVPLSRLPPNPFGRLAPLP